MTEVFRYMVTVIFSADSVSKFLRWEKSGLHRLKKSWGKPLGAKRIGGVNVSVGLLMEALEISELESARF